MAPYLLFGFIFAGILNEFISTEKIARHLGKSSFGSVLKAALFGIPLPLCSCGVIPPTMTLRKSGASRGSVLSFLIATPTSGVDSILATYSLLGPFFAVYRVFASFVAALFSGFAANVLEKKNTNEPPLNNNETAAMTNEKRKSVLQSAANVFHYAFIELLGEIGKWLVIGIILGGIISYALPDSFFSSHIRSGWQSIFIMLVIGIPIYVCATGSIPIAAALMMKGLNPGAAFVFLLAGPATNTVTITVIGKYLGKKTTAIYLSTLAMSSVLLGLLLDYLWRLLNFSRFYAHHIGHKMLPGWLETSSTIILVGFLFFVFVKPFIIRSRSRSMLTAKPHQQISALKVTNMSCQNCANTITNSLKQNKGIHGVEIDLRSKYVTVQHEEGISQEQVMEIIRKAGYTPEVY
jgi:uncharacterized membrane protein YraQ (UPF0718 family)/copper chaperone CopZ